MYKAEISKIRSRLPAILASEPNPEIATEYQSTWNANVTALRKNSGDKKIFFRDVLIMTIKLNRRFEIDFVLGDQIRKMILDVFVDDHNTVTNREQRPYSEQLRDTHLSGLQIDEAPSAKHTVFIALLSDLADVFDTRFDSEGAMKAALIRNLARLSVPIRTKSLLEKWAKKSHSFSSSFNDVKDDELRAILDLLYTIFCDHWGPSVTDRLMSQALERVASIPEAKSYPPQRIL